MLPPPTVVVAGQDHIDLVDSVVDRSGRAAAYPASSFRSYARSVGDLDGLSALIDEHVIGRRRDGHHCPQVSPCDSDAPNRCPSWTSMSPPALLLKVAV